MKTMVGIIGAGAAVLAGLMGADPAGAPGGIAGVVRFEGQTPAPTPIDMSSDPFCVQANANPTRQPVVTGDAGALRDVIVYVLDAPPAGETTAAPARLDQAGCEYHPRVIGLRTGQTLTIHNSDATLHNVHVTPTVNRGFNIGQPLAGLESRRTFDLPERAIDVKCDIHGWMEGYLFVFDHPFFATTGPDGTFTIDGLPEGEYAIEAWHPVLGTQRGTVTVTPDAAARLALTFRG